MKPGDTGEGVGKEARRCRKARRDTGNYGVFPPDIVHAGIAPVLVYYNVGLFTCAAWRSLACFLLLWPRWSSLVCSPFFPCICSACCAVRCVDVLHS